MYFFIFTFWMSNFVKIPIFYGDIIIAGNEFYNVEFPPQKKKQKKKTKKILNVLLFIFESERDRAQSGEG